MGEAARGLRDAAWEQNEMSVGQWRDEEALSPYRMAHDEQRLNDLPLKSDLPSSHNSQQSAALEFLACKLYTGIDEACYSCS
jgi:hypothetical protein